MSHFVPQAPTDLFTCQRLCHPLQLLKMNSLLFSKYDSTVCSVLPPSNLPRPCYHIFSSILNLKNFYQDHFHRYLFIVQFCLLKTKQKPNDFSSACRSFMVNPSKELSAQQLSSCFLFPHLFLNLCHSASSTNFSEIVLATLCGDSGLKTRDKFCLTSLNGVDQSRFLYLFRVQHSLLASVSIVFLSYPTYCS